MRDVFSMKAPLSTRCLAIRCMYRIRSENRQFDLPHQMSKTEFRIRLFDFYLSWCYFCQHMSQTCRHSKVMSQCPDFMQFGSDNQMNCYQIITLKSAVLFRKHSSFKDG